MPVGSVRNTALGLRCAPWKHRVNWIERKLCTSNYSCRKKLLM